MEERLFQAEQVQKLLINSSPDVIIKLSTDLKIVEFNTQAELFFGIKSEMAIKQNCLLLLVPENMQKKFEKEMIALLAEKKDKRIKLQLRTAKGTNSITEWEAKIILDNSNLATGIIMIKKL